MAELRGHVREELATRGVIVLDPAASPRRGRFLRGGAAVVRPSGEAGELPDRRLPGLRRPRRLCALGPALYLPQDWADDAGRRRKCHVPEAIVFRESWRIAAGLLERCRRDLPHGWVTGDDEIGRPARFRAWLRERRAVRH